MALMRSKRRISALVTAMAALAATGLLTAGAATPAPGDTANLRLTKTDSPDPVTVGQTLTYTVTVSNNGPDGATKVTMVDTLPNSVDFISASPSAGSCTQKARHVTCNLGSIPAGTPANVSTPTVSIQVRPTKPGSITNSATVTSAENDPAKANNTDTATTRVNAAGPPAQPTCRGVAATIVGTAGDNNLVGTGGRDIVLARAGDDVILTDGGKDLVCAGRGHDIVRSGGRGDRVFGGGGPDKLVGGAGADVLRGNGGRDRLLGGRGPDLMVGGRGFDVCRGGPGDDEDRSCEHG
jgi:uncharacterized repeat protein (TIGR01451 family)